ncbi:MAG: hypothetical protein QF535_09385, partial [Anaerolineales bacterium]|nr:hypothetical protein [Anaerolineales bacterium]
SAENLTLNADGSGNDVIIQSNASTKVTVDGSAGDVKVESGDLFFATADKGIVLGATSNTDANTLDDYEEGTWTATITAASSGTITLDGGADLCAYTKIGRLVFVQGYLQVSAISSPTGEMYISLPFTIADGTELSQRFAGSCYFNNLSTATPGYGHNAVAYEGNAYWFPWQSDGTTQWSSYANYAQASPPTGIYFGFSYTVA